MGLLTLPVLPTVSDPLEHYLFVFCGQSMNSDRAPLVDFPPMFDTKRVEEFSNKWVYEPGSMEFDNPTGQTDVVSQDTGTEGLGGVGLPTGVAFCKLRKSARVILLPCARGSTSITQWVKTNGIDRSTLFGSMVQRIQQVQQDRNVEGRIVLLFNQGNKDRDATDEIVAAWPDKCLQMREDVSTEIGLPNTSIVVSVSPTTVAGDSPQLEQIMAEQLAMTGTNLRVLDGRSFPIDVGGHYTAEGFMSLADRYAALSDELL